ncbi:hypothetical protein D3C72_1689730 [compost metagenome]
MFCNAALRSARSRTAVDSNVLNEKLRSKETSDPCGSQRTGFLSPISSDNPAREELAVASAADSVLRIWAASNFDCR